jgi:hypothetical protein
MKASACACFSAQDTKNRETVEAGSCCWAFCVDVKTDDDDVGAGACDDEDPGLLTLLPSSNDAAFSPELSRRPAGCC